MQLFMITIQYLRLRNLVPRSPAPSAAPENAKKRQKEEVSPDTQKVHNSYLCNQLRKDRFCATNECL